MKEVFSNPALSAYHRVALTPARAPRAPSANHSVRSAPRPEAARVEISSQARELAEANGTSRADRVEALRAAVKDGTYPIDSEGIAKGMLQS